MADRRVGRLTEASAASDHWRDTRALARFEAFLFSAVATVLIVRSALAVAGYPQVGGGGLHVAHVLWGGLLMGVAIVSMLILPGSAVRVRAAVIGGVGFGLFIDEIGKFLTKDVNYFYRPSIAIMYAVFVVGYLAVRELLQRRRLNDRRRLALAATALSDLALGQLDHRRRSYALRLLDGVDETSGLSRAAAAVRSGLQAEESARHSLESRLAAVRDRIADPLERRLTERAADLLLVVAVLAMAADLAVSAIISITHPGKATALPTALDTWLPTAFSALLLVVGLLRLRGVDQRDGVDWLQRAVLVQLLVVQLVLFNRTQWLGMVGFVLDVVVLWLLKLVIRAGERHGT